jgi:L-threonylcarbamoyladenylate synthase
VKTEHLVVDAIAPASDAIARAASMLRAGGLVAFPTETVYGLGAHALDARAVARIFAAKGRPAHDPLIVHLAGAQALAQVAGPVPTRAWPLIEVCWPGPLTLVLPRHAAVPDGVTAGGPTVAVRVPRHPVAHALLVAAEIPVAAPSANLFSHTSPTTAAHVLADLDGRIDLLLDGGPTPIGVESTVLDVTGLDDGRPAVILRPGGVTLETLRTLLGEHGVVEHTRAAGELALQEETPLASPGLLDRHYAPQTPLWLFAGAERAARNALFAAAAEATMAGERPLLLLYSEDQALLAGQGQGGFPVVTLGAAANADDVARQLYGALRLADGMGATLLLARDLPGGGLAAAVRDRLRRAAVRLVECPPVE